ncbi:hypothetical protein GGR57DRAFT_470082 [Xylariaceae sp. FL1272]|nr:hypothetical protein GGR57DRAFT_470082 [Xylariaceae sp. FL1272]
MAERIELGNIHQAPSTNRTLPGYSRWASWIASDLDSEPLVFRKFDELASLNILYLQSEMLDIERQLRDLDQEDIRCPDIDSVNAARQWEVLIAQSTLSMPSDSESIDTETKASMRARRRMKLILRLRTTIKEYHEALTLLSRVAHLQIPSKRVLGALKQMFYQDGFPMLDGQARGYLDAADLVALRSPAPDPLSNYLRKSWAVKTKDAPDGLPRIGRFEEQKITHWVNIITILVATVLLIGPILALYFARSPSAKLALIAVFTAAFAGGVSLITRARRAEIFFGTATYAAVLVVFVSNGDLSGG